ncbi:GLPGLI family protein [Mucilaginibacter paludis]|uniref:GLPGLI family protein n=1 Tax=Mucilaginibacter paludis DSM 18603 TaxID=714943 RepID=H1YDH4_9SPHI|nr:GLPGLI family protein [Mucilaginibacter paludis]EHQ30183.1 Protein of unknown function, Porph ging [Mucilaginibacter paludis DSM 18603]
MIKYSLILVIGFAVAVTSAARGQNAHFTVQGVIEFDKTVNTYALFRKNINSENEGWMAPAFDAYKKNNPQFKVLKSKLAFLQNKTLFTPATTEEETGGFDNNPMIGQNNIIYNDLKADNSVVQKKVFEETFLVKDSLRKINWKITTETRDILGYKCRRANALILDSVYVVAFYTDEIPVSGGPECFNGLPGMILGVALPHENVTWFASKLSEVAVTEKDLVPPKKGKPTNNSGLHQVLLAALKEWGEYAKSFFKAFSL